jgi:predicted MFS family arabinose efflux permease
MALRTNPRLLVVLNALQFALFPLPVITLFWIDHIGMSVTDVMVLQAIFGIAVVLLEFPTGYFADRVGYRTSLLIGALFWGAGWALYARGTTFAAVMIAEIVLGAGAAFISGADRALLWVSLAETGRATDYTRWEGRVRAAAQTSEAASAAIGGWLYALGPRLPFWAAAPAAVAGFAVAFGMTDTPRAASAGRESHLRRALHVLRFTLWRHPRLPATIALSVTLGLSTFVMVWLIQPYMRTRDIPPAWFGLIWGAAHLWLAGASMASARIAARFGVHATLLGCCALIPVGYAGLALTSAAWGVVFYLCFMTIRGTHGPLLAALMQEDAPGEDRASVLSLNQLAFRLAFVVAGPPIGALVDRIGMNASLCVLAVGLTAATIAAVALFARAHR